MKKMLSILPSSIPFLCNQVYAKKNAAVSEIDNLTSLLYDIIRYAGILIAIYGLGMLILSMKSENSDAMSKHAMQMVIGIVLMSLKTFLK